MDELTALRLPRDGGKFADFLETAGRQLPAGVAVDASRVNEKVASDVRVETFFWIRHGLSLEPVFSLLHFSHPPPATLPEATV
jgi:hypothetical protein